MVEVIVGKSGSLIQVHLYLPGSQPLWWKGQEEVLTICGEKRRWGIIILETGKVNLQRRCGRIV